MTLSISGSLACYLSQQSGGAVPVSSAPLHDTIVQWHRFGKLSCSHVGAARLAESDRSSSNTKESAHMLMRSR